jgi:hypothetical protein
LSLSRVFFTGAVRHFVCTWVSPCVRHCEIVPQRDGAEGLGKIRYVIASSAVKKAFGYTYATMSLSTWLARSVRRRPGSSNTAALASGYTEELEKSTAITEIAASG